MRSVVHAEGQDGRLDQLLEVGVAISIGLALFDIFVSVLGTVADGEEP